VESTAELVDHIVTSLQSSDRCPPHVVRLLWRTVLRRGVNFPQHLQEKVLSAIHQRLLKLQSKRDASHKMDLISVHELSGILLDLIFLGSPSSPSTPHELYDWSRARLCAAFAPHLPLDRRWKHLKLLAYMNHSPFQVRGGDLPLRKVPFSQPQTASWYVMCLLSALRAALDDVGTSVIKAEHVKRLQDAVLVLWRMWQTDKEGHPAFIQRCFVASFLHFAGWTGDVVLKDACHRYCHAHKLWTAEDFLGSGNWQAQQLVVKFVLTSARCNGSQWRQIFDSIQPEPDQDGLTGIVSASLSHCIRENAVRNAQSLYSFAQQRGLQIPVDTVHSLVTLFVLSGQTRLLAPFFRDDTPLLRCQEFLGAVLRGLINLKKARINSDLASIVCNVMWKLYRDTKPPSGFQQLIEYIIPVLAASGHPAHATAVAKYVISQAPYYLRIPCLTQLLRVLLRLRHFRRALSLFKSLSKHPIKRLDVFRRKLVLSASASPLGQQVALEAQRIQLDRSLPQYETISIAHALQFRLSNPDRSRALKVMPIVMRSRLDAPTVHLALCTLVRAGRTLAAKQLFKDTYTRYSTEWRTSMCNVILDGTLAPTSSKHRQLVKRLFKMISIYTNDYDFVPDRITVNIMLKALVQWNKPDDPRWLYKLFDHIVRSGYPAGPYTKGLFNTPVSTVPLLPLPDLPADMSFKKHVKPMYNMFIKAFYLQGDAHSARKLHAILRSEQVAADQRRVPYVNLLKAPS
jgi:hypothetical protein